MTNNQQLKALMKSHGLTQIKVVALLNTSYQVIINNRSSDNMAYSCSLQTVKTWLADPDKYYYKNMPDIALQLLKLSL